jgi:transcriptional antiterminator/mannitol/fructose-specific phosphotransferase system IIA component (Ntr-type)
MILDDRSIKLLKEILMSPGIKVSELQRKFALTRQQAYYSLNKINDWLAANHLPVIQKNGQSGVMVDPIVSQMFPELMTASSMIDYVPSEMERCKLILLMLLGRRNEISLFHLSSALKVSRNTVLLDLKNIKEMLKGEDLHLAYTRRGGYDLHGQEMEKRKWLIKLVREVLQMPNGKAWLLSMTELSSDEVTLIQKRIEQAEKYLQVRFTDEILGELPYIFALLNRRIKRGQILQHHELDHQDIRNTREYQIAKELFGQDDWSEPELLFIALQLLSSNLLSATPAEDEQTARLTAAIDQMLQTFEQLACITFHEKEHLIERLLFHLRPAYYRIIYGIPFDNPMLDVVVKEHGELHHLVKKSIHSFKVLLKKDIPESECAYITMLIGGWLQKQGDALSERWKAIVVCPNGISVSKLLLEMLRELFPEFIFLDAISVREFADYQLHYDLVFSTVFLNTDKKWFLVKPLLSAEEKRRLRLRVSQELLGFNPMQIDLEQLIEVIQQHAAIENKSTLKTSLKRFFQVKSSPYILEDRNRKKPDLADLLTSETILIHKGVSTWQDAIHLASTPLIDMGSIDPGYVDAMIRMYDPSQPYIVIAPRVALPHARPEDGVSRLTMSMLCMEEGVEFAKGLTVNVVIVIAAVDRKQHLKALMQLNQLVSDPVNVTQIIQAGNKESILRLVEKYSKLSEVS